MYVGEEQNMVIELKTKQGNKIDMDYTGGFMGVHWYKNKFYAPIGGMMIEVTRDNDEVAGGKTFSHEEFDSFRSIKILK